jgi:hypothetical protein
LAGSGGGTSSDDELLMVDSMLFCDGEEDTPSCNPPLPLPFMERLVEMDERRSLAASDLSGRFEVNCCVNSITTGKAAVPVDELTPDVLTASVDEASNELALEPALRIKI